MTNREFVDSGKAELLKVIGIFLTLVTMIVAVTLFIADRPTRAEVKDQINATVNNRIERIEKKVDEMYNFLLNNKLKGQD